MKYDGAGRRISKTSMRKSVNSDVWDTAQVTHYTGIGTEVRENYAGSTKDTKVVVNMPQGLGRYGIEDAERPNYDGVSGDSLAGYIPNAKFEWYLKNHLGSTMLVYGTQSDANPQHVFVGTPLAAYDYRAFGEMVEMLPPAQKVTENFTGKEHDDEIALDYFGARYLDPMLGMWISVDPKRQFASPYLYAGNGVNPVNVVAPDGNYTITEFNTYDPAFRYGFQYSGRMSYFFEGFYGLFVPLTGLIAWIPAKGQIKNSLKPSATEGVISSVFDIASFTIKRSVKVASWVKTAFKIAGPPKFFHDVFDILEKNPKFEIYMSDLTQGNLLYSSNLEDLTRKAEWATSYGLNLYNQDVEINDEVRTQFYSDFQSEFADDSDDKQ
jgi:RHS repeat-associated protein